MVVGDYAECGKYRYYLGLHRIPNEYSTNDSTSRIVARIYHCSLWGLGSFNAMVETYLTKNGLPIDKDPSFQYDRRFGITTDPETGEKTVRLHLNREPRFYADIAYDRATNFELDGRDGIKGGKGYTLYLRMGEINPETNQTNGNDPLKDNITPNGYLWKNIYIRIRVSPIIRWQ